MARTARKSLSVLLSICLACLMMPFTAFGAEEQDNGTQEGGEPMLALAGAKTPVSYREYTATVAGGKATLTYEDRICTEYLSISEAETEKKITTLEDNCWYVVDQNYTLNYIKVGENVRLILCDGCTLTCELPISSDNKKTVDISEDSSLTIYGQENNTGTLIAPGEDYHAGIDVLGELNVHGGTIEATGGMFGAGIGNGNGASSSGIINIYGGIITATGGNDGAGIGNGAGATADETINIYGGEITAKGGSGAAGIGAGSYQTIEAKACWVDSSGISIYGGTINATGGTCGAGIGGGDRTSLTKLTIAGGDITAQGGKYAAGIGGGELNKGKGGNAYNITITGGTINATGGINDNDYGTAGIGGGSGGSLYGLTITGGSITAIGGNGSCRGCGIGGCYGKDIVISGGKVHAESSPDRGSAAIGCDYGYNSYSITISGGYVDACSHYNGAAIGCGSWAPANSASYVRITGGTVVAETNADGTSPSACTALGVGLRSGGPQGAGTLTVDTALTVYDTTGTSYVAIDNDGGDMASAVTGIESVLVKASVASLGFTTLYGERTSAQSDDDVVWTEATGISVTPTDGMAKLEFQCEYAKRMLGLSAEEFEEIAQDPDAQISMSVTTYTAKITDAQAEGDAEFSLHAELTAVFMRDGQVVKTATLAVTPEDFTAMQGGLIVTMTVPEGREPTQVLHTNDDGTVVYDDFRAAGGTATFEYDSETRQLTIQIDHCSHLIMKTQAKTLAATGDATPVAAVACLVLLAGACMAFARRRVTR